MYVATVSTDAGGRAKRRLLLNWFSEASETIADLGVCSVIAKSLLTEITESDLTALRTLDTLTRDADLWLLTHPCPEPKHGEHVASIVAIFVDLGSLFEGVRRDPAGADDGKLSMKVKDACHLVTALQVFAAGLEEASDD